LDKHRVRTLNVAMPAQVRYNGVGACDVAGFASSGHIVAKDPELRVRQFDKRCSISDDYWTRNLAYAESCGILGIFLIFFLPAPGP
jgi:hypothetical protein